MENNFLNLKKKFFKIGYFTLEKILSVNNVNMLIDEIKNSKNIESYFDKNGSLRRIEKIYDKGKELRNLNNSIINLLKKIFDEEFIIFKDKFNAKPPGGEGFFAHFDGVFHFTDSNNNKRNGWYEYGDYFINVLIALDKCDKKNGSIELSKAHKGEFEDLIVKTKNDGTPALKSEIESKLSFKLINLDIGDIVIFSNTCPHRSKQNVSNKNRRILYYTYSLKKNGSKYKKYFKDKKNSKNLSKALAEK